MLLQILGCGTIIQTNTAFNCSGYLIDGDLLFDCGPGVWRALHAHRRKPLQIGHIFLTHFHVDHCADLAPVLQERYINDPKGEKSLRLYGPQGLRDWFGKLTDFLGKWAAEMPVSTIEFYGDSLQAGSYTISSLPTVHTQNSICYRLEKDNVCFFYSGDTDENENVHSLADGCQLLLLEASHTRETQQPGHLTPQLAARIAERAGAQKLCLTHMYPEVRSANPTAEAARYFDGEIYLAEDGLQLIF